MYHFGLSFCCLFFGLILFSCTEQNPAAVKPTKKSAQEILGNKDYPALCYGGYRMKSRDQQPSMEDLKEDLQILNAMGIKVLRTYNVHYAQSENLLKAIRELKKENNAFEMYIMLGAWIDCKNAWQAGEPDHNFESERNQDEIARAVSLTNEYQDIIIALAVGNEAMVKWATSYYVQPSVILKWVTHLQNLKETGNLPSDLWITSSDNFASWGGGSGEYHVPALDSLIRSVDFISMHTYPMHDSHYNYDYWLRPESQQKLDTMAQVDSAMLRAKNYAINQYNSVVEYMVSLGVDIPVHIGETGWASISNGFYGPGGSKACDEYKQARYYSMIKEWAEENNVSLFFFEAFDEPWKDSQNAMGSENHFGLIDLQGRAKYAIWEQVDNGSFEGLARGGYTITKSYEGKLDSLKADVLLPPATYSR